MVTTQNRTSLDRTREVFSTSSFRPKIRVIDPIQLRALVNYLSLFPDRNELEINLDIPMKLSRRECLEIIQEGLRIYDNQKWLSLSINALNQPKTLDEISLFLTNTLIESEKEKANIPPDLNTLVRAHELAKQKAIAQATRGNREGRLDLSRISVEESIAIARRYYITRQNTVGEIEKALKKTTLKPRGEKDTLKTTKYETIEKDIDLVSEKAHTTLALLALHRIVDEQDVMDVASLTINGTSIHSPEIEGVLAASLLEKATEYNQAFESKSSVIKLFESRGLSSNQSRRATSKLLADTIKFDHVTDEELEQNFKTVTELYRTPEDDSVSINITNSLSNAVSAQRALRKELQPILKQVRSSHPKSTSYVQEVFNEIANIPLKEEGIQSDDMLSSAQKAAEETRSSKQIVNLFSGCTPTQLQAATIYNQLIANIAHEIIELNPKISSQESINIATRLTHELEFSFEEEIDTETIKREIFSAASKHNNPLTQDEVKQVSHAISSNRNIVTTEEIALTVHLTGFSDIAKIYQFYGEHPRIALVKANEFERLISENIPVEEAFIRAGGGKHFAKQVLGQIRSIGDFEVYKTFISGFGIYAASAPQLFLGRNKFGIEGITIGDVHYSLTGILDDINIERKKAGKFAINSSLFQFSLLDSASWENLKKAHPELEGYLTSLQEEAQALPEFIKQRKDIHRLLGAWDKSQLIHIDEELSQYLSFSPNHKFIDTRNSISLFRKWRISPNITSKLISPEGLTFFHSWQTKIHGFWSRFKGQWSELVSGFAEEKGITGMFGNILKNGFKNYLKKSGESILQKIAIKLGIQGGAKAGATALGIGSGPVGWIVLASSFLLNRKTLETLLKIGGFVTALGISALITLITKASGLLATAGSTIMGIGFWSHNPLFVGLGALMQAPWLAIHLPKLKALALKALNGASKALGLALKELGTGGLSPAIAASPIIALGATAIGSVIMYQNLVTAFYLPPYDKLGTSIVDLPGDGGTLSCTKDGQTVVLPSWFPSGWPMMKGMVYAGVYAWTMGLNHGNSLDITGNPTGTEVYATHDGYVSFAGWQGGYGNLVTITTLVAPVQTTKYAHLKGIAAHVRGGAQVTKGQVIGWVDSTGNSSGTHLHYELVTTGEYVGLSIACTLNISDDAKARLNSACHQQRNPCNVSF